MTDERGGRELTPREDREVEAADASLTPVEGDSRDVERFDAGPRAHSVSLTEERSAQIVRQSANARNVVFLAILAIALFIPVYWFYESGVPALGTEGRMAAEVDEQYVTDVARGYELYQANCSQCHGDNGQGGVGPPLNDQGKLYNALTAGGDSGTGHLNPDYIHNVLNVGGRYVCGDPNSLMQAWQQPAGPLNYRQVEELIAWITASKDVVFERKITTHGTEAAQGTPEVVSGWRDPAYVPGPDDTPVPDCWKAPDGLVAATASGSGSTSTTGSTDTTTTAVAGGTPDNPRVIDITATASLQFLGADGAQLTQIEVIPGETVEFVIDNTAGFDHNFWIGTADQLQVPSGETDTGVAAWASGEQTVVWTVPEQPVDGLEFACTVPGHYTSMHGDIVFANPDTGAAASGGSSTDQSAQAGDSGSSAQAPAAGVGTADAPRVVNITATAALQFLGADGAPLKELDVAPGETIEFVIDNQAGFDHDFWIGTADEISVPNAETDAGITAWQTGEQTLTWTAPEAGVQGLQFGCTVPGHYAAGMHGDIVVTTPATPPAASAGPSTDQAAPAGDSGSNAPAPAANVGTPDAPKVVHLTATAALQLLGQDGNPLKELDVAPGETVEFVVDNTAGFDHNFWIGPADELSQPNAETDAGIATWQSGEQTLTWTVPESGTAGLQFGCTIPGHYAAGMHGDIVIQG